MVALSHAALAGVIVESLEPSGEGAKAGLRVGDVLTAFSANEFPPYLEVSTLKDWQYLCSEMAPGGRVALRLMRAGKSVDIALPPGRWGVSVAPHLADKRRKPYEVGLDAIAAGRFDEGIATWSQTADSMMKSGKTWEACWLYRKMAEARLKHGQPDEAMRTFEKGATFAEKRGEWRAAADIWDSAGASFKRIKDSKRAKEAWEKGLRDWEKATPTLGLAKVLDSLAINAYEGGDNDLASKHWKRSLEVHSRVRPGNLDEALCLMGIGKLEQDLGEYDAALTRFQKAVAIARKLSPGSLELARGIHLLGMATYFLGDFASAEKIFGEALAIREKLAPGTAGVAATLNELGIVAFDRGELDRAEEYHRRALDIRVKLSPESLPVAKSLNNLGNVANRGHDYGAAEEYYKRALAIKKKISPGSMDEASTVLNLGGLAWERGDYETARARYLEYLKIIEALEADGWYIADALSNLGTNSLSEGDPAAAEGYLRRALALYEKSAPGSLSMANCLKNLGQACGQLGRAGEAISLLGRSHSIYSRMAPASAGMAECANSMALLCAREGKAEEAERYFSGSLEALDAQVQGLGGGIESRSGFAAAYTGLYLDYIDFLIAKGRTREAFGVLERSRTRVLMRMMAERDLVFSRDIPTELDERRRLLSAEYDRVQSELDGLSLETESHEVARTSSELTRIKTELEAVASQIRRESPHLASLQYPTPLGCDRVLEGLREGTLLLSYCVGHSATYIFALGPARGEFNFYSVPISDDLLGLKVRRFRQFIGDRLDAMAAGASIARELLGPVADPLRRADRVVVIPDGPLHFLPFAALTAPVGKGSPAYLAEIKPLRVVPSASAGADTPTGRLAQGSGALIFGDPELSTPTRLPALRGLPPLPAARAEAEAIAAIFPGKSEVLLGAAASEGKAKEPGKGWGVLHFACHGLVNPTRPLDSGLALAGGPSDGGDNGFLQAWEIFESVRVDADLVTLSACQSGLGQSMGGEGLIGLTRAFQYAGARAVLASLWSVQDESTAALMRLFYGYLRAGSTGDEALSKAQTDLIKGGGAFGHPYHWAAFQLYGGN